MRSIMSLDMDGGTGVYPPLVGYGVAGGGQCRGHKARHPYPLWFGFCGDVSVLCADSLLPSFFFHLQSTSLWEVPGHPFLQ